MGSVNAKMTDSISTQARIKTLDDFPGNRDVVERLRAHLFAKGLQPVLISGPAGSGKKMLARLCAKELGSRGLELVRCTPEHYRRAGFAKQIKRLSGSSPLHGVRVYIFDEAHRITNDVLEAVLDLVETRKPYEYLLLCTSELEQIHTGLRMRCIQFQLEP
jgi:DNA polymerase III delta prime subunit